MARRRNKAARRQVRVIWVSWVPTMAELFDLAPADWTPPAQVKIHRGIRHSTWTARFTTPTGDTPLAKVRLEHCADGSADVVERSLGFAWVTRFPANPERTDP